MAKQKDELQIYNASSYKPEWWWRVVSSNKKIIAKCTEPYKTKRACLRSLEITFGVLKEHFAVYISNPEQAAK